MKKLIKDFIKDSAGFIFIYFLNTFILILFFWLYYTKAEILYPLCLSLFIFFTSIIVRWFRYKTFNSDIVLASENAGYKIKCFTGEQRRSAETIEIINKTYAKELSDIKIKNRENSRLISQFIHSLKAPVTVIDIAVSNLSGSESEDDESDNTALSDIKMENEKILSTLDNLLSILRLEEFQLDYSSEAVNLKDSLNRIINEMKRNFIYGKVVPKVQCSCTDETVVYTDEKWNSIMLKQFISNGIKYSMAEKEMKPLYFVIAKENEHVTLSIRDEGIGIPEYDLGRITDAFFTGENGRRVKNSSGIGLYIAKKISEKLKHKLEIKSEPLKGTEIKITYLSKM